MSFLPDFRLETYFSRWEFTARYHLTASDAESMPMHDLLALADEEDRSAWEDLRLGYTQTWGDPGLRAAIAGTFETVAPEDVLVFAGAQEALFIAMEALLDADDHAIVITPNYQAAETVPLALCEVTGVALDEANGWQLDLEAVRSAMRPNTKVVSVNFPNNPTGAVMEAGAFAQLATLCDERGVHLFSDEVYRGLELDPERTLPQAADISERALSLNVTSKSLGLPGLRIGWIACRDREVLSKLERAKHYTSISNAAPSEILARIGIKARERIWERNRAIIAANVPLFDGFFARYPELFEWEAPAGGCVCFPRYLGDDGVEAFCTSLVEDSGVLLLPASIFHSELAPIPADRFRLGVGRANPEPGLAAFSDWLDSR